jgi:hypothetical protein
MHYRYENPVVNLSQWRKSCQEILDYLPEYKETLAKIEKNHISQTERYYFIFSIEGLSGLQEIAQAIKDAGLGKKCASFLQMTHEASLQPDNFKGRQMSIDPDKCFITLMPEEIFDCWSKKGLEREDLQSLRVTSKFFSQSTELQSVINKIPPREKIAQNGTSTLMVNAKGELVVLGSNKYGQLGLGQKDSTQCTKVNLDGIIKYNERIISVYLGRWCSFFLTNKGRLFASGHNVDGQCGLVFSYETFREVRLDLFPNERILSVSADQYLTGPKNLTLILTNKGRVFKNGNPEGSFQEIQSDAPPLHPNERYTSAQAIAGKIHRLTDQNRLFLSWASLEGGLIESSIADLFKPDEKVVSLQHNATDAFLLTNQNRIFSRVGCHSQKLGSFEEVEMGSLLVRDEKILLVRMNTQTTFFVTSMGRVFHSKNSNFGQEEVMFKCESNTFQEVNLSTLELNSAEQVCSIYPSDSHVVLETNQGRHFSCGNNVGQFGSNVDPVIHEFTLCSYPEAEPAGLGCTLF